VKVLHVYRTYYPDPPGGLQEAIRQICISTQAYGVENTVFTLSPKPQPYVIERSEAKIVRCRSWAAPASCDLGLLDSVSTFRALADQADIVHYYFPWPYADLLRMLAPQKPSVMTYISDIVRQRWLGAIYRPLMWHTLVSMDRIIVNSPSYINTSPVLSSKCIKNKVKVAPLGIEESSYDCEPDYRIFNRNNVNPNEGFVLFIGVLRYYKGLHILLEACQYIRGKIVIAGAGPEENNLRSLAKRLRLKNVIFTGPVTQNEKKALLRECKCLVLPSHLRSEAFGMVLVEASMMGKPMVTTEIGTGTSFVNLDGETGFVVPAGDPSSLANSVNVLLYNNELSEKLGKAARKRYETMFSGPVIGKVYADIFYELLGRHSQ